MTDKPSYLLLSSAAIDALLASRSFDSDGLPAAKFDRVYREERGDVVAFALGSEHELEYSALVSCKALSSLPGHSEAIYARIGRVLKAAERPPIHLPRGWSEFHYKNRLAFFAVPEEIGSIRWHADVASEERVIRFLELTHENKRRIELQTWEIPTAPAVGWYREWVSKLEPMAGAASDAESFAEQVDLKQIGSGAVLQGKPFERWYADISPQQRAIVDKATEASVRVVGPAGSGKTLTLCMRAIRLSRSPEVVGSRRKILVVTHSWAMAERIDGVLRGLAEGTIPESISVLPLLYVLQVHAGSAGQGAGSILGEDSAEGRQKVLELVERIVTERSFVDGIEDKKSLSEAVLKGLQASDGSYVKAEFVLDLYEEIVGVLSAQNILPGDSDKIADYLSAVRDDSLPPFKTRADRELCLGVFARLLDFLVDIGSITTDQLVLDSIRVLETFTWNVKRETEGYDYILVDELQLFDAQERMAISLLSRSRKGMVFLSVEDPSQGLFSATHDRASAVRSKESVLLEETHRFRSGLFEFISFLYASFPLNAVPIKVAKPDAKTQRRPKLYQSSTQSEVVDFCLSRAREIAHSDEKGRRLCVVCLGEIEDEIAKSLHGALVPVVRLRSYDDVEKLAYQKRAVVVSSWQFIGGTQFSDVILVTAGTPRPGSAFAKLRELTAIYLGASRAMSSLDVVCDMRVPAAIEKASKQKLVVSSKIPKAGAAPSQSQKTVVGSRYVLSGSASSQFRFVLKAGNNETILTSERYTTKAAAINGIVSVRANSPDDARYVRKNAINGSPMFNLRAANNEVIGTSEMYSSSSAREVGIASVKANGPAAIIEDQSS